MRRHRYPNILKKELIVIVIQRTVPRRGDYVDEYISTKYDIRFNEISHEFQISIKDLNSWEDFEANSLLIELAKSNIEINPGKLDIYLRSNLISRFNPRTEYFDELPRWIEGEHIRKLAS